MTERKRWKLRVTFEMVAEGPEEEDFARFHFEENHCVGNLIRQLYSEYEREPGVCVHCGRAEVKLVGPAEGDDE